VLRKLAAPLRRVIYCRESELRERHRLWRNQLALRRPFRRAAFRQRPRWNAESSAGRGTQIARIERNAEAGSVFGHAGAFVKALGHCAGIRSKAALKRSPAVWKGDVPCQK